MFIYIDVFLLPWCICIISITCSYICDNVTKIRKRVLYINEIFYNGLSKSFEYLNLLDTALILRQWLEINLAFWQINIFLLALATKKRALDNKNIYMNLSFELALNWIYSHNRYARNKSPFIYEYPPLHKPI